MNDHFADSPAERDAAAYVVLGWKGDDHAHQGPMPMADAAVAAMGLEHGGYERVMIRSVQTGVELSLEDFLHEHPGIGGAA